MEYMDLKNDNFYNDDIKIENLPKYATMPMALESVRSFVRRTLRS